MQKTETIWQQLQAFLHGLLFVPFVIAQFFAQGTMLSDGFEVVLCSASGPVSVTFGADGEPQPADHGQDTCAWAIAGQPVLAGIDLPILPPASAEFVAVRPEHAGDLLPSARVLRPQARGPPVLI